jgi:hypothetical protein
MKRFMRFLTTAEPTRFETVTPRRDFDVSPLLIIATKHEFAVFVPVFEREENAGRFLSLSSLLNPKRDPNPLAFLLHKINKLRRQLVSSSGPAAIYYSAPGFCRHSLSEPVRPCPFDSTWLKRSFHNIFPILCFSKTLFIDSYKASIKN